MGKRRFSTPAEDEPDIAAESDRRGTDRFCTVCRIAKIVREDDEGLWRVRNISDRGMMLAADVPVEPGERLQIALSDTVVLNAQIVWADDGRCGVTFDEPVDGTGILKQLAAEQRTDGYRPPRLSVRTSAKAVTDDGTSDVEITDVSQSGAGIVHDGQLEAGKELELVLVGGLRRKAIVRWSKGGRGGLWLTEPLDRADLESIRRFET